MQAGQQEDWEAGRKQREEVRGGAGKSGYSLRWNPWREELSLWSWLGNLQQALKATSKGGDAGIRGPMVPAQAGSRGKAGSWGLSHLARQRPPGQALQHLPWAARRGLAQIFQSQGRLGRWSSVPGQKAGQEGA